MDTEQSTESRTDEEADQPQDQLPDDPSQDRDEGATHGGADTPDEKAAKTEDNDEDSGKSQEQKDRDDEYEAAKQEVKKLEEEGPPEKLEDWPEGKAKYETFGGPEVEHSYDEGPESQLGPDSLRHHEDGGVEVKGEKVDDAEEYKGEPIPGGPTDPNTPNLRQDNASPEDASVNEGEGGEDSESDSEDQQDDEDQEKDEES